MLNETKTYCIVGNANTKYEGKASLSSVGISISYENSSFTFSGIKQSPTKCYVFLDIDNKTPSEKTLVKLGQISGSNYTIKEQTTFSGTSHETTQDVGKVVYKFKDNDGDTYVFRGNPDNWVTFVGKTWRIIRVNGDGTLRLLYYCDTTSCDSPKDATESTTAYKSSPYNDNTYVGYYYGTAGSSSYETTHKSIKANKSTIAGEVNKWYEDNLKNSYADKLSGASGWCNDRTISTAKFSDHTGDGTVQNASAYGATGRFVDGSSSSWPTKTPVTPQLTCSQNDLFTTENDKNGNKILDYPIGLITADEVIIGGLLYSNGYYTSNYETGSYVSSGSSYWTMSPSFYNKSFYSARVFYVHSSGYLCEFNVDSSLGGVRPVINVNLDKVTITGKGTSSSQFVIT